MNIESKYLRRNKTIEALIKDEEFRDFKSKREVIGESRLFIKLYNKDDSSKFSILPKNYILGVSEVSNRVAKKLNSNQFIYILITGEKFTHKIEYGVSGLVIEYREILKRILPNAIITNDYSMDIWRDMYKEDCNKLFMDLVKENSLIKYINEFEDFYSILSRDGRFSKQLKEGDTVEIADEDARYVGKIAEVNSGSHIDGTIVTLESGESGRVKRILSEIKKPVQYVDTEEYNEDLEVYKKLEEDRKKHDFRQKGRDPKTGYVSRFLTIAFVSMIVLSIVFTILKNTVFKK